MSPARTPRHDADLRRGRSRSAGRGTAGQPAPTRWPPSRPTSARCPRLRGAAARRAEPAAVGAGPYRLVPGMLAGAQPAARAGRRRRPRGGRAGPACAPSADALYNSSRCRTTAAGRCRCPTPRPRAPTWRHSCTRTLALLADAPARRRRRAVLLPPGAAARGHAPRGRALHGAGRWACRSTIRAGSRAAAADPPATWRCDGGPLAAGPCRRGLRLRQRTRRARGRARRRTASTARRVRWAEFLPFVEAGGYAAAALVDRRRPRLAGAARRRTAPRYLRREAARGSSGAMAAGSALDPAPGRLPPDAARSRWPGALGRPPPAHRGRVGTRGAARARASFRWGDVWEWTASAFAPYPGFAPHPYRDYSAPWFDGRPVLRGASFATQPRMRHPRYRNYFPAAAQRHLRRACAAARCRARADRAFQPGRRARPQADATMTENQPCASVQCCTWRKPASLQQGLEVGRLPFVGIFGVDALAGVEGAFGAGPAHLQGLPGLAGASRCVTPPGRTAPRAATAARRNRCPSGGSGGAAGSG